MAKARTKYSIVAASGLAFVVFLGASQSLRAQICSGVGGGPILGEEALAAVAGNPTLNCNPYRCYDAILGSATYETVPAFCDPSTSACSVRARVETLFNGNDQNPTQFSTPARIDWNFSSGAFAGSCGNLFGALDWEKGNAWLEVGGFRCVPLPVSGIFDTYKMTAVSCPGISGGCQRIQITNVALTPPVIASQLCPSPPPPWSCGEGDRNSCSACSGPSGGLAVSGGGASVGGAGFGPKAVLHYHTRGAGHPAHPKPSNWNTLLGRNWSHSYATAIVLAPDVSHVWLLTEFATFREFFDANLDGVYESARPSDEHRRLEKTLNGWTLTTLDGMVTEFDSSGRWARVTDRNGNAKIGTYTSGRLSSVAFPDGRREDFAYTNGRLGTITEVGIDGTSTRVWTLTWVGQDLKTLARPDGTRLEFFYTDPANPGAISRYELVGTDGTSRRVLEAWAYDTSGNVVRNWKGDASFTGPNAVAKYELSFDDPAMPTESTLLDPLGTTSTYTIERDSASIKPRIASVAGDCPVCGSGPNVTRQFDDPQNPLRPTLETDGNGVPTLFSWDVHGQMTSRTEAFSRPLERTTSWSYHPTWPALITEIERPSTTGNPLDFRRTTTSYDAQGNPENRTLEGLEDGVPFSYTTVTSFTPEGLPETIDPPGYGTADQTLYTYDPLRGELLPATRTEPIIGTTTFGYDAFNRQTSVTDVNGVVTETLFDALDRPTFVIRRGATTADDLVTQNVYSSDLKDLFQTILPKGNVIEYGYDAAGRLRSVERKPNTSPTSHGERTFYTLDGYGHRIREDLQRWESNTWVTKASTAWEYANRCQLAKVIQGVGSANESITEHAYDCDGNLQKIWDANHDSLGQTEPPTTLYAYDDLDRVASVSQPFGGAGGGTAVTHYQYDVQDHLSQVTDAEGGVTTYTTSDRDLLTREVSEVSGTTTSTYNEHGELETQTDARGVTMTRTLDALDRPTFVDYPDDTLDVTNTYDDPLVPFSKGRLTRIERDGQGVDYRYDRFGRMTQDGQLGYLLDKNGNRQEIGYPGGVIARFTHDYADREATLQALVPGEPTRSVVTASSYLPLGPMASMTLGNGFVETHAYDTRYFPDRITITGGTPRLDWDYTVDKVGNPTLIADLLNPPQNRTYDYQDFQYYLTLGNGPWGNLSWTYDRIGNRLSETRDGITDSYSYVLNGAGGHTAKLDEISLGAGGLRAYGFDPAGNQTQVAEGTDVVGMSYDDAGRLARIERPSVGFATDLLYDGRSYLRHAEEVELALISRDDFETGDLACWSVVVGGTPGGMCPSAGPSVGPTYSSEGMLHHQLKPAGLKRAVLYFAGRPVAILELPASGPAEYLLLSTDHLGTPMLASTLAGVVSWSGGFEPFGADWSGAEAAGVFLRFPGQWGDGTWANSNATDLTYYNVNRWYQPTGGRYSQADPIARWHLTQDLHYAYAANEPMVYVDSLGLRVVFGSPELEASYGRLKSCYPLFRAVASFFENDRGFFGGPKTWSVSHPGDRPLLCQQGSNRTADALTVFVPAEMSCRQTLECIFHEFYERWAIAGAGFPHSQMGAGPADRQARKFEKLIPSACCRCEGGL